MNRLLYKRICAILCALSLIITFSSAFALESDEITEELLNRGVPYNVISQLSESEKEFIYDNLSPVSSFDGYSEQDVDLNVMNYKNIIEPKAAPPSNKLTISLLTFNEAPSGGYSRKSFYPMFQWKQSTVLQNDAFGFSLGSGWYVETPNQQLGVHIINSSGAFVLSRTLLASQHANQTQYGTCYQIPQNCGSAYTKYKGGAVFYAQKRSSAADDRLHYDYISNNSGIVLSLSFPVTAFASITVLNINTSQYNQWNGLLSFPI